MNVRIEIDDINLINVGEEKSKFFQHAKELDKTLHHPADCTSNVTTARYSVCFIIQGPLGTDRYLELIDTPV